MFGSLRDEIHPCFALAIQFVFVPIFVLASELLLGLVCDLSGLARFLEPIGSAVTLGTGALLGASLAIGALQLVPMVTRYGAWVWAAVSLTACGVILLEAIHLAPDNGGLWSALKVVVGPANEDPIGFLGALVSFGAMGYSLGIAVCRRRSGEASCSRA